MVEAGVIIGTTCLIERVQSITHSFSGRISWKRREEKGRAKKAVGTTGYMQSGTGWFKSESGSQNSVVFRDQW